MKTKFLLIVILIGCMIVSCGNTAGKGEKETQVLITTNFGNMKVKLYNETPLHRDNFIKLVKEGYYDDLLFHRVIKSFMIQGGDPESKGASSSKHLGGGGPEYTINAEIKPELIHKKGALAAARQGDNVNPERKSSGSQFYIVQGKVYQPEELQQFVEQQKFRAIREEGMKLFRKNQATINRLQQEGKRDSLDAMMVNLQETAEKSIDTTLFQISEARKAAYTTVGGTPFLDGAYTVFGEVIEGFEVIDSIAAQQVGQADRPITDIVMKMTILE